MIIKSPEKKLNAAHSMLLLYCILYESFFTCYFNFCVIEMLAITLFCAISTTRIRTTWKGSTTYTNDMQLGKVTCVTLFHFKGWFPLSRNFYVRTCVKSVFANEIEAMHERSLVSVNKPRSTSSLSSVLFILPLFYLRWLKFTYV